MINIKTLHGDLQGLLPQHPASTSVQELRHEIYEMLMIPKEKRRDNKVNEALFHGGDPRATSDKRLWWAAFKKVYGLEVYDLEDARLLDDDDERRRRTLEACFFSNPFDRLWTDARAATTFRSKAVGRALPLEVIGLGGPAAPEIHMINRSAFRGGDGTDDGLPQLMIGSRCAFRFVCPFDAHQSIIYQGPSVERHRREGDSEVAEHFMACLDEQLDLRTPDGDGPIFKAREIHEVAYPSPVEDEHGVARIIGVSSRDPLDLRGLDLSAPLTNEDMRIYASAVNKMRPEDVAISTFAFRLV